MIEYQVLPVTLSQDTVASAYYFLYFSKLLKFTGVIWQCHIVLYPLRF